MMDLAQVSRPSLWTALLWKDFQQVKQTFAVVTIGFFVIQLMLVLIGCFPFNEDSRAGIFRTTLGLVGAAPILIALGCSGMLIGQERQSGTWAWTSSMPVTWQQAMGSKIFVSIVGSLAASILLAIVPLGLYLAGQLTTSADDPTMISAVVATVFLFMEVLVFSFLATVLMRETLTALVVVGIGLTIGQIILLGWLSGEVYWSAGQQAKMEESIFLTGALALILLTASVLLVAAFRWRWGTGQRVDLVPWRSSKLSFPLRQASKSLYSEYRPSEMQMLFRHALVNSLWLRVSAVLAACAVTWFDFGTHWIGIEQPILLFMMLVLGVTTFDGDQLMNRFRFLADRGVEPWKLVLSRLSVAASFGLALSLFFAFRFAWRPHYYPDGMNMLSLVPIVFFAGAFASMCFNKSVIAIAMAMMFCIVGLVTSTAIVYWVQFDMAPLDFQNSNYLISWIVFCFTPIAWIGLLLAIFHLSRRWLVLDQPQLVLRFFWIVLAALLSPVIVACTIGFLMLPNVRWQGSSPEEALSRRVELPNFSIIKSPLLTDSVHQLTLLSRSRGQGTTGVEAAAASVLAVVREDIEKLDAAANVKAAYLAPTLSQLDDVLKQDRVSTGVGPFRVRNEDAIRLDNLIVRTAALATIALQKKDSELALRLWRLNRELQESANKFLPLYTHASRNVAMHMLLQVSDADIVAMGGPAIFSSLIPSPPDELAASILEARDEACMGLQRLRSHWFAVTLYYPPLRWLAERSLANKLEQRLELLNRSNSMNFLTVDYHRKLLERDLNR